MFFEAPISHQVIVEKDSKAKLEELDKKKYLVPSDLTGKTILV